MISSLSQRIKKINGLIKRELGQIMLKEIDFSKNILVTITRVESSANLQQAKVFVSVIGEKETIEVLRILEKEIYNLQQLLNHRLVMRPVPKIKFVQDRELEEATKIDKILDESGLKNY